MNLKDVKKGDIRNGLLILFAACFCMYVVIVGFSGLKDARATTETETLRKSIISDSEKAVVEAKEEFILEMQNIDLALAKEKEVEKPDVAVDEALRKKVTLLDNSGNKFGEVCFEAADDTVFMSYGWVGLAERALVEVGENRSIDDIKIEVIGNCDNYIDEPVVIDYNPMDILNESEVL